MLSQRSSNSTEGWIVGGPDGVASHFFQQGQLSSDGTAVHCSTNGTQVMVVANSLDQKMFSVQEKTFLRVKAKVPDAQCCLDGYQPVFLFQKS